MSEYSLDKRGIGVTYAMADRPARLDGKATRQRAEKRREENDVKVHLPKRAFPFPDPIRQMLPRTGRSAVSVPST